MHDFSLECVANGLECPGDVARRGTVNVVLQQYPKFKPGLASAAPVVFHNLCHVRQCIRLSFNKCIDDHVQRLVWLCVHPLGVADLGGCVASEPHVKSPTALKMPIVT